MLCMCDTTELSLVLCSVTMTVMHLAEDHVLLSLT